MTQGALTNVPATQRAPRWGLVCLDAAELRAARTIVDRYADQQIGLADASNVVLAQRFGRTAIATLDRRHFSVLRASGRVGAHPGALNPVGWSTPFEMQAMR